MEELERMGNHLSIVTEAEGETIGNVPVQDPFHTTNVTIEKTLWDWVKFLWAGKRSIHVRVKVRSDGVAQGRWFQRAVICDNCKRTRIDDPHHPPEHDHGYHHGSERWCEACYYSLEIPSEPQAYGESNGPCKA